MLLAYVSRRFLLRCDLASGASGICTRCRRLSRDCAVDRHYKRTNRSRRVEELDREIRVMRSMLSQNLVNPFASLQDMSPSTWTLPADEATDQADRLTPSPSDAAQTPVVPRLDHERQTSSAPEQAYYTAQKPRSLDEVTMDQRQINQSFSCFFADYHPYLSLLDPTVRPDAMYQRSPLLFWTIIAIASRRHEDEPGLLAALQRGVMQLVWRQAGSPPFSRPSVQAMLLLAAWPFPTSSFSTGHSFMLVTMAKAAAMQLGMHRPDKVQEFSRVRVQLRPGEFQDMVKCWATCYIITQRYVRSADSRHRCADDQRDSITGTIGFPTSFQEDWTIKSACESNNEYSLPHDLRQQLRVYRFFSRVNQSLAGDAFSPSGRPSGNDYTALVQLFESDYGDLERQLKVEGMTAVYIEVTLLFARLQLHCYHFFEPPTSALRKVGLVKAYATALALVKAVNGVGSLGTFVQHAPIALARMLTLAALVLMKIVYSSYAKFVDVEQGRSAFDSVMDMMGQISLQSNDIQDRGRKILSELWIAHQSLADRRQREPTVSLQSRLGGSILHDSLWMWRELFGGQAAPAPQPASGPSAPESEPQQDVASGGTAEQAQFISPADNANGSVPGFSTPSYLDNGLGQGFEGLDWLWDVNCPALLPLDLDQFEQGTPATATTS
ncbi:hypothetical protein ANO11243_049570 [Dothideomycetidae sp. 11243]|nr:hypothetical protein ANO11243_049570 [fungal sp. No.11243]